MFIVVYERESAFINGWNLHNRIRLIIDMADYRERIKTESLVLFLVFYKVFDIVDHSFLFETLHHLGFAKTFCKIIKMFYINIFSYASLNTGVTPWFEVKRGICQGCPIFHKLFILTTYLPVLFSWHLSDLV